MKVAAIQHDIVWEDRDGELRAPRADDRAGGRATARGSSCSPRCSRPASRWRPSASPSRSTARARSSSSSRPRAHGVWVCGSVPERARRATTRPSNRLVLAAPDGTIAPLPQDPPVHATRGEHEHYAAGDELVTVDDRGRAGAASSSATTCASPTSSGRSRPTPTATSCVANWPAPRRDALADAAAGARDREPGVRRRRQPRRRGRRPRLRRRQRDHRSVRRGGRGRAAIARRCSSATSTRPWSPTPARASRSSPTGAEPRSIRSRPRQEGDVMESFKGKLAVVTGGGTGMGGELVVQLAAEGCSVATCDVNSETLAETAKRAANEAPPGARVTTHLCDVVRRGAGRPRSATRSSPQHDDRPHQPAVQQRRHRRRRQLRHRRPRRVGPHVRRLLGRRLQLLPRVRAAARRERRRLPRQHEQRERLLGVARPGHPAHRVQRGEVRGEGLLRGALEDFRVNAPHVKVAVVMPGHIGTDIVINSRTRPRRRRARRA